MHSVTDKSDARDQLRGALAAARTRALRPPPRLHVDQWADRFRVLSPEASSTPGRWDTKRVEVARGVMRAVTEPGVRKITVDACTQLLKTECLNNILGYQLHLSPGPLLVIQPTEGMAEAWSKDRLAPMLRDTPVLRGIISSKSRDAESTILHKKFPGGHLTMVGANSPAELASRPIRDLYADEVDKYPTSAGEEGDPITIAAERADTFPTGSLVYHSCSPTIRGKSKIERLYQSSDRRVPMVSCPHCGVRQVMRFGDKTTPGGVKWPKDDEGNPAPERALYHCSHCTRAWSEGERLAAIQGVTWHQTRPFKCCGVDQDPLAAHEADPPKKRKRPLWAPDIDEDGTVFAHRALCSECGRRAVPNRHAGFWASKLYSPWKPVSSLAEKFLLALGAPEEMKAFVNTSLAETYEEQGEQADAGSLKARREAYPCGDKVPDWVVALFTSVDTQRNRLEAQTVGMGADERLAIIDYRVIDGDPALPETLQQLEKELWRPRVRGDGEVFYPEMVGIDVGDGAGAAGDLYRFCDTHRGKRCVPLRGAKDREALIWPKKTSISRKHNATVHFVGTQRAKSLLASRLRLTKAEDGTMPPGYIALSTEICDDTYLAQLTAEKLVRKEGPGGAWYEWTCPKGTRNEALDTLVYCWALYEGWQKLHGRINQRARDRAFRGAAAPSLPAPPAAPAQGPTEAPAGPTAVPERPTPSPARGEAEPSPSVGSSDQQHTQAARRGPTRADLAPRQQAARSGWLTPRRGWR